MNARKAGCKSVQYSSRGADVDDASDMGLGFQRLTNLLDLLEKAGFRKTLLDRMPRRKGRQRGLLPLPYVGSLADYKDLPPNGTAHAILHQFLNAVIAALNGLYAGQFWQGSLEDRPPTKCQHKAIQTLISRIYRLAQNLSTTPPRSEAKAKTASCTLNAEVADHLPCAGTVDAYGLMGNGLYAAFDNVSSFIDPTRGLPASDLYGGPPE